MTNDTEFTAIVGRLSAEQRFTLLREIDQALAPPTLDDEDGRVVFTDTSRPITVERIEMGRDRAWLSFSLGDTVPHRMLVEVDIVGGRPGLDLIIMGHQIGGSLDEPSLTLADLRQIHADLGAMLADERLLGALAEQEG